MSAKAQALITLQKSKAVPKIQKEPEYKIIVAHPQNKDDVTKGFLFMFRCMEKTIVEKKTTAGKAAEEEYNLFEGGIYIGWYEYPEDFNKAGRFMIFNENGIFLPNEMNICTTESNYHSKDRHSGNGIYGFICAMMGAMIQYDVIGSGINLSVKPLDKIREAARNSEKEIKAKYAKEYYYLLEEYLKYSENFKEENPGMLKGIRETRELFKSELLARDLSKTSLQNP